MTVVVDLGCADFGSQNSVRALIRKYRPARLYGFDPNPVLKEGRRTTRGGTEVELSRRAAWLYDGEVGYHENITRSYIDDAAAPVPCFDFSHWLEELDEQVILKMDVEGAEYELLNRLIDDGTIRYVDELVIEWHEDDRGLGELLTCPVRDWWM